MYILLKKTPSVLYLGEALKMQGEANNIYSDKMLINNNLAIWYEKIAPQRYYNNNVIYYRERVDIFTCKMTYL